MTSQSYITEVKERFPKDVAGHQMQVISDDGGCNRHICFQDPQNFAYHFSLITWPGHLCITGDMGCFVFARVEDMFAFFRDPSGEIRINASYWAEKSVAAPKHKGIEEWSLDLFKKNVRLHVAEQMEYRTASERRRAMGSVNEHILENLDNEFDAVHAIWNWSDPDGLGINFHDFWEYSCYEYTFHYLWCCHAIVWGIQQYDAMKDKQ